VERPDHGTTPSFLDRADLEITSVFEKKQIVSGAKRTEQRTNNK
jgi:hypothetical protein